MSAEEAKQKEEKPKTAREVAFDGMCSTIRQAYREWERQQKGEAKAWSSGLHVNSDTSKSTLETAPSR